MARIDEELYGEVLGKVLKRGGIVGVTKADGLVKVDATLGEYGGGLCGASFVFTKSRILCYGDVPAYSWITTWDAAKEILKGNCYAKDPLYLAGKLEHREELMEFSYSDNKMGELRKYLIKTQGLSGKALKEFEDAWYDNQGFLYGIDKYRLNNLDDFFDSIGMEDGYEYYWWFEKYPTQYYWAVAGLRLIEERIAGFSAKEGE